MALILQKRIEAHTGDVNDPPMLNQFLQQSVREVVQDLPLNSLQTLYTDLTDSGSGVSTMNYRIVDVHKSGYRALPVNYYELDKLDFTATEPGYYTYGGTTYVKPSGGTVVAVEYPTVTLEDDDLSASGVPFELENLICLRTAARWIDHEIACLGDALAIDITLPTAPTAPSAPTISYTDAAAVAPSSTTIGSLPSVPSYTGQSASLSAAPSVGTLDLSTKVDGVTSLTPPTAPTAPTIAYSDGVAATVTATTVSALGTAPAYTKTASSLDFTNWDTYLSAEDPEIMAENVRKLSTELDEIRAGILDERNEFEKELAEYEADARHKLEQARITLQEQIKNADDSTRVSLENERQTLAAAVADWEADLNLYRAEIQQYQTEVDAVIQEFARQLDPQIQVFQIERQTDVAHLNAKIADARADLDANLADHRANVDKVLEQARIARTEAEQTASQSTDVAVRNKAQQLAAAIADYEGEIARYTAQVQSWATEVEGTISEANQEAINRQRKIRMLTQSRQAVERQYMEGKRQYIRTYSSHRQVKVVARGY